MTPRERSLAARDTAANLLKQATMLHRSFPPDVRAVEFVVSHETLAELRLLTFDNDVTYAVEDGPETMRAQSMHQEVATRTLLGVRLNPAYDVPDGEIRLTVAVKS